MAVPCAVLMCHAPIVIPPVAGQHAAACATTTAAMRTVAAAVVAHEPDVVAVISPHAPRHRTGWGVVAGPTLSGDFGTFGAPHVRVRLPVDAQTADAVVAAGRARGLSMREVAPYDLDHGSLVPLYFLQAAGWSGPTLVLAMPWPGTGTEALMGMALADAARRRGLRLSVVASGDMSHRLVPGAPAGFHPRAKDFDAAFVQCITAGDLEGASSISVALREHAAEDVVDSVTVAAGAIGFRNQGHRLIAYEGPFGVGYCEAILHTQAPAPPRVLLDVARGAVQAHLTRRPPPPLPTLDAPWSQGSRAVFVTILGRDGELRGCIGHLVPQHPHLAAEVSHCAILAATRDPRMQPMTAGELPDVLFEVTVLEPPEPTQRADLDPRTYGVLVRASDGRQGVLLPDLEGIDTVERQLQIVLHKARIRPHEPYRIERFTATKVEEAP